MWGEIWMKSGDTIIVKGACQEAGTVLCKVPDNIPIEEVWGQMSAYRDENMPPESIKHPESVFVVMFSPDIELVFEEEMVKV
jgi:hypothetical protein